MPKETFFNLPAEKQALIFDVAIAEFALHPYEQASVNRVVARADIAKGSFYQYFENKKDLYLYLLQRIGEAKLDYLAPVMGNARQHDFFTLLRDLYAAGIQFGIENPRYVEISKRLMESKGSPIYTEVMEANTSAASELFETLLRTAISNGEVRPDIDVPMFAYLIASMNTLVMEYYIEHIARVGDDQLLATVEQFIDFLKNGIGASAGKAPSTQGALS